MDFLIQLDKNIILSLHSILSNCPIIQGFFSIITSLGNGGFIWIILGLTLFIRKSSRKYGILMLFSLIIGAIIGNLILKNIFDRNRPFIELALNPFISPPYGYSFPSGHSLSSFIGSTFIFKVNRKFGVLTYILAILIAISRVILMVHYPSDVIIGGIIGIIISNLVFSLYKNFNKI